MSTLSDARRLHEPGPLLAVVCEQRRKQRTQRKRGLDCGFAAQISRENRQVTEPLCLSWTGLK